MIVGGGKIDFFHEIIESERKGLGTRLCGPLGVYVWTWISFGLHFSLFPKYMTCKTYFGSGAKHTQCQEPSTGNFFNPPFPPVPRGRTHAWRLFPRCRLAVQARREGSSCLLPVACKPPPQHFQCQQQI